MLGDIANSTCLASEHLLSNRSWLRAVPTGQAPAALERHSCSALSPPGDWRQGHPLEATLRRMLEIVTFFPEEIGWILLLQMIPHCGPLPTPEG